MFIYRGSNSSTLPTIFMIKSRKILVFWVIHQRRVAYATQIPKRKTWSIKNKNKRNWPNNTHIPYSNNLRLFLTPPPFFAMKTPGLPSTQVSTFSQDLPEVFSSREHLWEGLCLEGYVQWPTLVASIMSWLAAKGAHPCIDFWFHFIWLFWSPRTQVVISPQSILYLVSLAIWNYAML